MRYALPMTQQASILDLIEALRGEGKRFAVATVVRTANATSAKAGAKCVVAHDGRVHGFVGGTCVTGAVRGAALAAMASAEPRLIRVKPKEDVRDPVDIDGTELHKSSCPSGGTVEIFIEPMHVERRVVICGDSPVVAALVTIARATGFEAIVAADGRYHDSVPGANRYVDGFDLSSLNLTRRDAVVVATQGKSDRVSLREALRTPAGYIGMIGSRRKIAVLKAALEQQNGVEPSSLDRVHGPAGIDIGAIGPEEIALSILTQIVALQRRVSSNSSPTGTDGQSIS